MKHVLRCLKILLLCPLLAQAGTESMLDYSLKNLSHGRSEMMQQFTGKPIIMSFFEPECSWCFKQLKALEVLANACDNSIQPIAIGVNGSRPELKQIFARTRATFPAYEASNRMLADIEGVPATPISIFIDPKGQLLGAVRGYKPLGEMYKLMAMVDVPINQICPNFSKSGQ